MALQLIVCWSSNDGARGVVWLLYPARSQQLGKLVAFTMAVVMAGSLGCDDGDGNNLVPDGGGLLDLPVVNTDNGGTDPGTDTNVGDTTADATPDVTPDAADTAPDAVADVTPDNGPDLGLDTADTTDTSGSKTYGGGVYLIELDSEFVNTAVAGARFTTQTTEPVPDQVFGDCSVSYQDPDSPAAEGFGYDAGSVTIVATNPTVVLNAAADGNGTGYSSNLSSSQENMLPAGGAIMNIALAGGADIGEATITVQAPEAVTLIAPDVGGFSGGNASKSSPLTVAWSAGNGDQVVVTISPLTSDLQPEAKSGDALACILNGDAGSVTIPSAALTALSSGKYALGLTRLKVATGSDAQGNTVSGTVTRSTGGLLNLN